MTTCLEENNQVIITLRQIMIKGGPLLESKKKKMWVFLDKKITARCIFQ